MAPTSEPTLGSLFAQPAHSSGSLIKRGQRWGKGPSLGPTCAPAWALARDTPFPGLSLASPSSPRVASGPAWPLSSPPPAPPPIAANPEPALPAGSPRLSPPRCCPRVMQLCHSAHRVLGLRGLHGADGAREGFRGGARAAVITVFWAPSELRILGGREVIISPLGPSDGRVTAQHLPTSPANGLESPETAEFSRFGCACAVPGAWARGDGNRGQGTQMPSAQALPSQGPGH